MSTIKKPTRLLWFPIPDGREKTERLFDGRQFIFAILDLMNNPPTIIVKNDKEEYLPTRYVNERKKAKTEVKELLKELGVKFENEVRPRKLAKAKKALKERKRSAKKLL